MIDLKWLRDYLQPAVGQHLDRIFPEFEFRKGSQDWWVAHTAPSLYDTYGAAQGKLTANGVGFRSFKNRPFVAWTQYVQENLGKTFAEAVEFLADQAGMPMPETWDKSSWGWSPNVDADTFARSRGFTAEDYYAINVQFPTMHIDGKDVTCQLIQVRTHEGQTAKWIRPCPRNNGARKPFWTKGARAQDLFFPENWANNLYGKTLVIAGGLEKMMACRKAGFDSVWPMVGENKIGPRMIEAIKAARPGKIVVAMDSDDAGLVASIKLCEQLAKSLPQKWFNEGFSVHTVLWPYDDEVGTDCDSYANRYGSRALARLLHDAPVYDPERGHPSEWDEPEPIIGRGVQYAEFPIDVFPHWLREYITQTSAKIKCYPDGMGMPALSIISGILHKRFKLCHYNDYKVQNVGLYTMTVLGVSERKSSILDALLEPLSKHEAKLQKEFDLAEIVNSEIRARLRKEIKAAVRKGEQGEEEARALAAQLKEYPSKAPRFSAGDVTEAVMKDLLATHKELLLVYPEGLVFFDRLTQFRNDGGADVGVFLSAFTGETIKEDRRGMDRNSGTSHFIESPSAALCLMCQPRVLDDMGKNEKLHGHGLMDRFLFSIPPGQAGYRDHLQNRPVAPQTVNAYWKNIEAMIGVPELPEGMDGRHWVVKTDREADVTLRVYQNKMERRMRPGEGDLSHMPGLLGKVRDFVSRIAFVLHACEYCTQLEWWRKPITAEYVDRAIAVFEYSLYYADRFVWPAMGITGADSEDAVGQHAREFVSWLLSNNKTKFDFGSYVSGSRWYENLKEGIRKKSEAVTMRNAGGDEAVDREVNKRINAEARGFFDKVVRVAEKKRWLKRHTPPEKKVAVGAKKPVRSRKAPYWTLNPLLEVTAPAWSSSKDEAAVGGDVVDADAAGSNSEPSKHVPF